MAEEIKEKKLGGSKTVPFIVANEVCERFSTVGFNGNIIQYLTNELHLPLVQASNTISNFKGATSFTPLIGGLIADSFAGRFSTVVVGSIFYQIGILGVILTAIIPILRPPSCSPKSPSCQRASSWQLLVFYFSYFLTAVGTGGIRPCVPALGADQFEQKALKEQPAQQRSFFNYYFMSMEIALLLSHTVVVYVQDNVGWGLGFGIPAIAMLLSCIFFILGYPFYIRRKPAGSPITRLSQVLVSAVRKWKLNLSKDHNALYQNRELDADISTNGLLKHTDHFRFLDRAAIITESDITGDHPRPWRLSTVHRIEELKCVLRMVPIWSVGILTATAVSHNSSFAIIQAKTMDRHLAGNFKIPPASLAVFANISLLITLTLQTRVLNPLFRRLTFIPTGLSYLHRIGLGLAINIVSNICAAVVEKRRRSVAESHGMADLPSSTLPMSVFWLVPQIAVHGVYEAFTIVGRFEFFYDQSPESIRSTSVSLYWLAESIGSYGGTLLVNLTNHFSRRSEEGSWLQDNINKGKMDNYYWLVAALQLLNLCCYIVFARFYKFKALEIEGDDDMNMAKDNDIGKDDNVELADGTKT